MPMDVTVTTGNGCGATSQLQSKSITYNGQQTIINKTKYVGGRELAGMMYWDMATDVDYANQLSLLRALKSIMNANFVTEEGLTGRNVSSVKFEKKTNEVNKVSSDFCVYPNPAKNNFMVALPADKKGYIKIFNLTGQQLFMQSLSNQHKLDINISNFKSCLYFVKYSDEKGNTESTKLMIQ